MKYKNGDLVKLKNRDNVIAYLPKELVLRGDIFTVALTIEAHGAQYILRADNGFVSAMEEDLDPIEEEDIVLLQRTIADYYGIDDRLDCAALKCAELIAAIGSYKMSQNSSASLELSEKIADVYDLTTQISYLVQCEKDIDDFLHTTVTRQFDCVNRKKQEGNMR